ncbi:MAG TPA: hypothetical protein VEH84_08290 [Alphaproteobacteria bacterium]|nr:hypothetical protein [Alphaproteobacteria bacterium]
MSVRETFEALAERMLDADERKFLQVFELLQHLPDPGAVNAAMATLRPRLKVLRPARRPSLKRLMCQPFEELLFSAPEPEWRPGRVWRGAIDPAWRLVERRLGRPALTALQQRFRAEGAAAGRTLWRDAAEALQAEAVRAVAGGGAFGAGPAGDVVLRNAIFMASVLDIADEVAALRAALPGEVLTAEATAALRAALPRLHRRGRRKPPVLLQVAAGWLRAPGQLLDAVAAPGLELEPEDRHALLRLLGEMVVEDLNRQAAALAELPPDRLAPAAARLAEALAAAQAGLAADPDHPFAVALESAAGRLAAWRNVLEQGAPTG